MNAVHLIGNLTRDPELRELPSGDPVCNLRIAVDKPPRNGEKVPPNYFTVVVFDDQATSCGTYLNEGRQIAVEGRLENREWLDDDDQRHYATEVVARRVQFLGGRRDDTTTEAAAEAAAV